VGSLTDGQAEWTYIPSLHFEILLNFHINKSVITGNNIYIWHWKEKKQYLLGEEVLQIQTQRNPSGYPVSQRNVNKFERNLDGVLHVQTSQVIEIQHQNSNTDPKYHFHAL